MDDQSGSGSEPTTDREFVHSRLIDAAARVASDANEQNLGRLAHEVLGMT
jgi:hypothetical protein